MGRTIHFISLGCAKNRVDTEVMLGVADQAEHRIVSDPAEADVIVVNTCGFIGPAKEESINTILEMGQYRQEGRCQKLVVAGCLSQRYSVELATELPEVDHFLGSSDMLRIERVLDDQGERMMVGNPAEYSMRASDPRILTQRAHSAFVKIAEGCNRTCSFCAIPSIRGKQRSRPVEDIVREVEQLVARGVLEINIISQDTIAYGRDLPNRPTLADVTRRVADVSGIRWVRLHYLYPEALRPDLVELLAHHPRVLPYVDMPLQHASDDMLRRMRRGHGGSRLDRVVERLRTSLEEMVFRTTFIVGHPGETDADFETLCTFVQRWEFDHVGVFLYSTEEGTASAQQDHGVPEKIKTTRHRTLMRIQRKISRRKQRALVGRELEVLVDGESDESEFLYEGRWWGQAPEVDGKVILANGEARPGELRRALVTQTADYDLVADLFAPDGTRDVPPASTPIRLPII